MKNFDACLKPLLEHEGGNDDDPQDPGGRTSRGIIQREWDEYVKRHPGLPSDVWDAPDSCVADIYRKQYWDVLRCDDLPAGVDYAVFDYGVNSGVSRAAKALQRFIGASIDGEIGPDTIYLADGDPEGDISKICDERLAFLQGLHTWPRFGRGWTTRVNEVRALALKMAAAATVVAQKPASGWLSALVAAVMAIFRGAPTQPPAPVPPHPASIEPPWMRAAIKEIGFHEIGENQGIEKYVVGGKTGGTVGEPWCADFANYCLEIVGIPGTHSAMARSFSHHPNFVKLAGPAYGAVVVMWRGVPNGTSGHVYFYKGETKDGNIGLGGNQKDSVCEQLQPRARVLGYFWPKSVPLPKIGPINIDSDASEGTES